MNEELTVNCRLCEKEFVTKKRPSFYSQPRIFCGQECLYAWNRKNNGIVLGLKRKRNDAV